MPTKYCTCLKQRLHLAAAEGGKMSGSTRPQRMAPSHCSPAVGSLGLSPLPAEAMAQNMNPRSKHIDLYSDLRAYCIRQELLLTQSKPHLADSESTYGTFRRKQGCDSFFKSICSPFSHAYTEAQGAEHVPRTSSS